MSDAQFCSECGSSLEAGALFCGNCGARIGGEASPKIIDNPPDKQSGVASNPVAVKSEQPAKSPIGIPLLMVGGGAVLAILAILFSGVFSIDVPADRPVQKTRTVEQNPDNETQLTTKPETTPKATSKDLAWKPYVNNRYGVAVDYPSALFEAGEPPADNAGRGFEASDGSRFYVYSSANALEQSIDELMAGAIDEEPGQSVIDRQKTADGFTVTMKRNQEIIHRRLMTSEGGSMLHWLEIGYPETARSQYSAIAEKMENSFRMVMNEETNESGTVEKNATPTDMIDIPLTGWTYNPAAKDFADLPALVPEAEYAADNQMGFLAFTCQPGAVSPAYFALLVAPGFSIKQENNDVRLGMEGAGASGELRLAMQDLYATSGGERPQVDWDATILFAPIEVEDLGQLIGANALLVKAAGQTWRLASGGNLASAGQKFFAACETDDVSTDGSMLNERGPDEYSFHKISSSELGFAVENSNAPTSFSIDIPDGWIRVPNTMDHELVFASPADDFDAQMYLGILAKPSEARSLSAALDAINSAFFAK